MEQSAPIEWEEYKEVFLGEYIPRQMRKIQVEECINLKQGNMSVEEYFLKFSKLFKYAFSLVENTRDKKSHFMTGVATQ